MLDNYTLSKQFFISYLYGENYYLGWIPTTRTACETGIHRENYHHSYSGEQLVPLVMSKTEGALLPSYVWTTEIHACAYSNRGSTCLMKIAQMPHSSRNWNLDLMSWLMQHFPHPLPEDEKHMRDLQLFKWYLNALLLLAANTIHMLVLHSALNTELVQVV